MACRVSLLLVFLATTWLVPGASGQTRPPSVGSAQKLEVVPEVPGGSAESKEKSEAKVRTKEHFLIAKTPECAEEVSTYCSNQISYNNLLVLDCLQDNEKTAIKLSDECHHLLWNYKLNLTKDPRLEEASYEACDHELKHIKDCQTIKPGEVVPCLIEHYSEVESKPCTTFLNKMASIIFSDFRLMNFFIMNCSGDIDRLKCGRLTSLDKEDDSPHSQGKTVECLTQKRKDLSGSCRKSLFRVAELQSEDFHLDRQLYYACKADRDNLCHDVVAGDGAVFKCLYNHLGDSQLSDQCREKLEERQQLIAEDVKIDKSFYRACKEDIETYQCPVKGRSGHNSQGEDLSRTSILLCLEDAYAEKNNIKSECLLEMFKLRSELMQDYKISPELVEACQKEINALCQDQPKGEVLHCLMKEMTRGDADKESTLSTQCKLEVRKLVNVANPGEDLRLDAPLMRACGDVISQACSDQHEGNGLLISCLFENLDHEDMTDECEQELLVIQYFASRDFRVDFNLFKQCREDAVSLCKSDGYFDPNSLTPDEGSIVFSCLHRHWRSDDPKDGKPSRQCIHEMKRAMRERSLKVNLMPEVEAACIHDLSEHCTDDGQHKKFNGEMECLQSALEDLTETCRQVVLNFTQEETQFIELDRTLMKHCSPMMRKFCRDLLTSDVISSQVLDCLIEHKHNEHMNAKCAASVEHHQILTLQDFHLDKNFHDACQKVISHHCKKQKSKYDVVACLSEIVRNDTIMNVQHGSVDKRCRQQIRFEVLHRDETVNIDKELLQSCDYEIKNLCDTSEGYGEVLECLRTSKKRLSKPCHQVLFKREKDEAVFGDYTLLRVCKDMIKKHCSVDMEEADLLKCLIENKEQENFDDRCRQVVYTRQVEETRDIDLNPRLLKACGGDILRYCSEVFTKRQPDETKMEGKVIDCLKKTYVTKNKDLAAECKTELQFQIKEAAVDINLNPALLAKCQKDISSFCDVKQSEGSDITYKTRGDGDIIECLKKHYQKLRDSDCKKEVAYSIYESRVDVHVDPLLHAACQEDLIKFCQKTPKGQGRQMSCLLSLLETDQKRLTNRCRNMLQGRKALWEFAAEMAPAESISELFNQVSISPARNYLIAVLFTVVGMIFIVGLTCGRVTKRVKAEVKNK